LAAFYWFGWGGFQQDTGEAMRLLEKAMVSDAKEAKLQHRHLFDETVLAGDLDDAQIQYIKKAADASDADALYSLGLRLFFGGDKAERALLLHKAAVLGSAPAALDLAEMYFRGSNGLGKSPQESVRLFQQAMAGDDPFTRHLIATLYEQGYQGLPKDEKQAAQLNKQASDEGDAFAQYALGRFYEEGKGGLPQDAREAARLYKLAADQGNGDATVALARYMADGRGGYEADKAKAVEYLKRAARWSTQAKDELTKMGG
jgi:TPR repeat protein